MHLLGVVTPRVIGINHEDLPVFPQLGQRVVLSTGAARTYTHISSSVNSQHVNIRISKYTLTRAACALCSATLYHVYSITPLLDRRGIVLARLGR